MKNQLLEIKGLKTYFYTDDGVVPAVDGVDISIYEGETVGIVGESGCGKSVTSLTTMRLTPGKVVEGSITFQQKDILALSDEEMRELRGNEMAMIFQEPMTSLNPVFTIGKQIGEAVEIHMKVSKQMARERSIEMLKRVGIPRPDQIVDEYPHQLSGGMRQRVMIAMAMSCQPQLLIADEPTTALDVTIQAQILDLIKQLKEEQGMAVLMITHDLGVVAEMCDRVVVMYAGRVVEEASVLELFDDPKHPYTRGLIHSVPKLRAGAKRLESIPGNVPDLAHMPTGCKFAPRCADVMDICLVKEPGLGDLGEERRCRCWLYEAEMGKEGEGRGTTAH